MANVKILLNFPRTELIQEGYGISKPAGSLEFAQINPFAFGIFTIAMENQNIWREPNTGIIMIKPSSLHEGFIEDESFAGFRIKNNQLITSLWQGTSVPVIQTIPKYDHHIMQRPSTSNVIDGLAGVAITALLEAKLSKLKPVIKTKNPLMVNEGFGCVIHPRGLGVEQIREFVAIYFGGKYVLAIKGNGVAELWEELKPSEPGAPLTEDDFILRNIMPFKAHGINIVEPIKIDIIPWGQKYISIIFTQNQFSTANIGKRGTLRDSYQSSYLINLEKWGIELKWSEIHKTHVIVPASHIVVCAREDFLIDLQMYKIRYPHQGHFFIAPEPIGEVRSLSEPEMEVFGFFGHRESVLFSGSNVDFQILNKNANSWNKDEDTEIIGDVTLNPSQGKLYTPEVWFVNYKIPEVTDTPSHDSLDVSDKWTYIRFQLNATADSSLCTIKLERHEDYLNLFSRGGGLRILADTADKQSEVPIFDGYVKRKNPTPASVSGEGLLQPVELEAYDLWWRLNNTPIQFEVALDGQGVGDVLRKLVMRAGFPANQIVVDATLNELEAIEFFNEPNSLKTFNPDAKCGDAIREIISKYGIQNHSFIRVRWTGFQWYIYIPEPYDFDNTVVNKFFVLDHSIIPKYNGLFRSDLMRWNPSKLFGDEQYFFIKSKPEWTIDLPEYNAGIFVAADGNEDTANRLQCFIPPHPDVLNDPSKFMYEGLTRPNVIAPPEIMAETHNSLEIQARWIFDQWHLGLIKMSFDAEWQPGRLGFDTQIAPDDLINVIGFNKNKEPISYGIYRIQMIDCELRRDFEDGTGRITGSGRYEWSGNYALTYVGKSNHPSFPMFSEVVPF